LVDSVSITQKMLKENMGKIKNPKVKKLVEEYNAKLEDLRSRCLATKQKSIFADEKKLREDITDVYSAISNQETKPSNLQMQRISSLQQQFAEARQANAAINTQYHEKVQTALLKEKIDTKPKLNNNNNQ